MNYLIFLKDAYILISEILHEARLNSFDPAAWTIGAKPCGNSYCFEVRKNGTRGASITLSFDRRNSFSATDYKETRECCLPGIEALMRSWLVPKVFGVGV